MIIEKKPPTASELAQIYREVGWIESPDLERMQRAVDHQSEWFVARENEGLLLGTGRIITDYVRYAFIVDVIVLESQRGKGIGRSIMQAILAECRSLNIDSINLWPSQGKVAFYEKFGFYALPADQPHMKLRKK